MSLDPLGDFRKLRSMAEGVASWLHPDDEDYGLRGNLLDVHGTPVLIVAVGPGLGSQVMNPAVIGYVGRALEAMGNEVRKKALEILASDLERARVAALPAIDGEEKRLAALRKELGA